MVLGATNASAQVIRDSNFESIGRISPNGVVRDGDYRAVGFFNPDGTVADRHGNVVGRITRDNKFLNTDGERVGYANLDGSVHDGESRLLGRVDLKTGKVTDREGKTIGYANSLPLSKIACYFFFDFFKDED